MLNHNTVDFPLDAQEKDRRDEEVIIDDKSIQFTSPSTANLPPIHEINQRDDDDGAMKEPVGDGEVNHQPVEVVIQFVAEEKEGDEDDEGAEEGEPIAGDPEAGCEGVQGIVPRLFRFVHRMLAKREIQEVRSCFVVVS